MRMILRPAQFLFSLAVGLGWLIPFNCHAQAPVAEALEKATTTTSRAVEATSQPLRWASDEAGVSLFSGETLLLRYEFSSGNKPIVYPIAGPNGVTMTRDFPMKPAGKNETKDHIHHRSLWFTHGDVNGIDFWAEGEKSGRVQHGEVLSSDADAESATLATTAKWISPNDKTLLHESRTMTVSGDSTMRSIEFVIDLTAKEFPVVFGDTKEGSFAVRVPDSVTVDAKQGGVIVNANGEKNDDAWGKRATWVDYSGPIDQTTAGIAILEHPDSYGHPCRWHVRSYGLFAANPYGDHHFTGESSDKVHKLAPGETMHLHYKVLLHSGNADVNAIQKHWDAFAGKVDKAD